MELLLSHLHEWLFLNKDSTEQVFIGDDVLYKNLILNIKYTSYEVMQEKDSIHIGYGQTGVMVYTLTLVKDRNKPWLYANILTVYHVTVYTASNPEPKTLTILWVQWMQCDTVGLTGPNT